MSGGSIDRDRNRIESDGAEARAIVLVPTTTQDRLNPREQIDYHGWREELYKWMATIGKDEQSLEGYAFSTIRTRMAYLNQFAHFVWEEFDGYTTSFRDDHADAYLRELAVDNRDREYSDTYKANSQKSLKMLFRWNDTDWDPALNFTSNDSRRRPKDYFTKDERRAIREAVLEYGTVPAYGGLTKDERERWTIHLAQRFRKATTDVGPEDFDRANGFKFPSMFNAILDAGFRPIEVGRSRTTWVDVDNGALRIPVEDASKERDNWTVALRDQTVRMLDQWLDERSLYEKYDGNDHLWLTRDGNPFSSRTLNYHTDKLCDIANIDRGGRDISAYCYRHSTGTYLSNEKGLESAAEQLRHANTETTRKYDNAPIEERKEGLENME